MAGAIGQFCILAKRLDLIDAEAVQFSRAALAQTDVKGEVICCEDQKTTLQ